MATYAKETTVTAERSRAEIEVILRRYGATGFAYAWQRGQVMLGFEITNRQIRFLIPLPDPQAAEFNRVRVNARSTKSATSVQREAAYEQAIRQRWRALVLVIKAKLEAVEAGISTIEREFLTDIVLPGGQTVGGWLIPQIEAVYESGRMPALLPGLAAGEGE